MALASNHFLSHLDLEKFVNDGSIAKANILKVDTDASSGGWVLWFYATGGATKPFHARQFQRHLDLTAFVNTEAIPVADILKIDADPSSGGWTLFWYE